MTIQKNENNITYKRDIAFAVLELSLQIPIGIMGILHERGKLNPWWFLSITFICQLLILMIVMRSTLVNIKSGNSNEKLINALSNDRKQKDNSVDVDEDSQNRDYCINLGPIKLKNDSKPIFAASILFSTGLVYVSLILLGPILYHNNLIGKKVFASLMLIAIICGIIIPTLFRSVSAIGSRSSIKEIECLMDSLKTSEQNNSTQEKSATNKGRIAKVLEHFKSKKVYYQESCFAGFEILVSLSLAFFIFKHSEKAMSPWLFAGLSCVGKIVVLCCIVRVLHYSFKNNDVLDELLDKARQKDQEESQNSGGGDLSSDDQSESFQKDNYRIIQEKGIYAVLGLQSVYIMLSTITPLLYQYKQISMKMHVGLSTCAFFCGTMTLIAFRLLITVTFRNNTEKIDTFLDSTNISLTNEAAKKVDPLGIKIV